MANLLIEDSDLEQLVWDDIQSDGLDTVCQRHTDTVTGSKQSAIASRTTNPSAAACSPSVSSMSEHDRSPGVTGTLTHATDDAGSGSATVLAFASAQGTEPSQIRAGDVASSAQLADMGPFASLEHHQRLGSTPSAGLPLHRAGSQNPSLVTYKTRALAAAAGSVRTGAVGSNLRLAAIMLRSNSGGLAETLISEQARAESGLLTAGLARCDSLPELCLAPSGTELVDLMSLRDMDAFSGMPSCAGLPSLSMLFSERPDFGAMAGGAADTQHQPRMGACPASAVRDSILQAATGTDGMWEEADALPGWISGSRFMGRPPSFSANGAAALFGGGSSAQPPKSPLHGLPLQTSGPSGGRQTEALKPPSIVDYNQMLMQKDPAPSAHIAAPFAAPAPGHACAPGQAQLGPAAVSGALGFEAFSLPSFGRMQPLLMERQDTFELLMKQVDQELTAEAEVKQYSALEIGTIEVPVRPQAAAPAGAAPSFIDEAAAAAVVPAVLCAAAESAAAPAPAPAPKRRSVFEMARPSVFEGHTALAPSCVSAVSAGGPPAAVLDTLGPSFTNWVPPSDPSNASQVSAATVAAGAAVASAGAAPVPSSPFCLPTSTALLAGGDSSTASALADSGATELVKQDVARYSRVITCKTYLKRLNITQPMAEHLLPPHDLSLPAKPRTSTDGGDDDDEGSGKKGTYDQLFKEQVVLIDEAGVPFRVQYEGVACNAQKHLRLTCGWRDYIRQHKVEVGDTVLFERRGDERRVIYITLVKASDAPVELGPETKKRRIGRKQAVQRLE